jgi:hypothetical protein
MVGGAPWPSLLPKQLRNQQTPALIKVRRTMKYRRVIRMESERQLA